LGLVSKAVLGGLNPKCERSHLQPLLHPQSLRSPLRPTTKTKTAVPSQSSSGVVRIAVCHRAASPIHPIHQRGLSARRRGTGTTRKTAALPATRRPTISRLARASPNGTPVLPNATVTAMTTTTTMVVHPPRTTTVAPTLSSGGETKSAASPTVASRTHLHLRKARAAHPPGTGMTRTDVAPLTLHRGTRRRLAPTDPSGTPTSSSAATAMITLNPLRMITAAPSPSSGGPTRSAAFPTAVFPTRLNLPRDQTAHPHGTGILRMAAAPRTALLRVPHLPVLRVSSGIIKASSA
jgi:hypothetical protein